MDALNVVDPIDQMEHWGYHLLPQFHPNSPGYQGLLVAIRARPTREHYDPESLQVSLFNPDTGIQPVTLNLLTPLHKPRIVAPGTIVLCDRRNKEEAFFLLGGTIESRLVPGEIVYTLRSTAPILWLTKKGESISDQLAAEFGALIAQARARMGEKDEKFFGRLASIEPLALYSASICSVFCDYEHQSDLRASYPDLHAMLHQEQQWLESKGLWPSEPLSLVQLLGL